MAFKLDDEPIRCRISMSRPLDVMLVLLVIFMSRRRCCTRESRSTSRSPWRRNCRNRGRPPHLSITRKEVYYLNETPIPSSSLRDRLKGILRTRRQGRLSEGRQEPPYGVVVETMDVLNRVGVESSVWSPS